MAAVSGVAVLAVGGWQRLGCFVIDGVACWLVGEGGWLMVEQ